METFNRTPTRSLAETSNGVREAAKNLQKLAIHWDTPRQIVLVTKPDGSLMDKVLDLINHMSKYNVIVYVEDQLFPSLNFHEKSSFRISNAEIRAWNAFKIRNNLSKALSASVSSFAVAELAKQKPSINSKGEDLLSTSNLNPKNLKNNATTANDHHESESLFSNDTHYESNIDVYQFNPEDIDLIITLGGDGTVLFASWVFQTIVPPLLPLHLGTLGFLTVFDFNMYKDLIDRIFKKANPESSSQNPKSSTTPIHDFHQIRKRSSTLQRLSNAPPFPPEAFITSSLPLSEKGFRISLRMRFTCSVYRSKTILATHYSASHCINDNYYVEKSLNQSKNALPNSPLSPESDFPEPDDVFQVLNDVVVDRGPSPYMASLEIFGDGVHLTTVQADGLLVSTPTGSTAYSLSAGGSLVHPEVPAILLTPICPHTLSFRPMLLPDSMELKIVVPSDARAMAFVSFDGRHRIPLQQGDALVVTASAYPVPTLCLHDQTKDWFDSLSRCLRWNERVGRQKNFVWGKGVVESKQEGEDEAAYPWDG